MMVRASENYLKRGISNRKGRHLQEVQKMNRWIYVKMKNAVCALIISKYNIVVGACPFLQWGMGQHFQDVKRWLERKKILVEWQEMGEIRLNSLVDIEFTPFMKDHPNGLWYSTASLIEKRRKKDE